MRLTPGANTNLRPGLISLELQWLPQAGVDADLSALLCSGRTVRSDDDFIFYNQPRDASGSVLHVGKVVPEALSAPVVDTVTVNLPSLPVEVDRVVIAASLDAPPGTGFAALSATGLSLAVTSDGAAVARVALDGFTMETAVVAVEIYRRDQAWRIRAVAQGYSDGLAGLARDFGVSVDESPTPSTPTEPPSPAWDWRNPPVPAGYAL